jgi:hypothetical protein
MLGLNSSSDNDHPNQPFEPTNDTTNDNTANKEFERIE